MRKGYHYTACGLDDVYLQGIEHSKDVEGYDVVEIPNVWQLHRVIAEAVVTADGALSPKEFRFLRSEVGLTQAQFAEQAGVQRLTVTRWENGESRIDRNAEGFLRLLAIEKLGLRVDLSVSDLWSRIYGDAQDHNIAIDASDPERYRAVA